MTGDAQAWVVEGTVAHRRHRPRPNAFRYDVWHLLVDVDHLEDAASDVAGFGTAGRRPVGIRRTDHLGDADLPLREKLARWVAGQGATLPDGPLLLYAYPRVLGHVFNPVAWWFAHDLDGALRMVVAEVRNTFGDWHAYLLDDLTGDGVSSAPATTRTSTSPRSCRSRGCRTGSSSGRRRWTGTATSA